MCFFSVRLRCVVVKQPIQNSAKFRRIENNFEEKHHLLVRVNCSCCSNCWFFCAAVVERRQFKHRQNVIPSKLFWVIDFSVAKLNVRSANCYLASHILFIIRTIFFCFIHIRMHFFSAFSLRFSFFHNQVNKQCFPSCLFLVFFSFLFFFFCVRKSIASVTNFVSTSKARGSLIA